MAHTGFRRVKDLGVLPLHAVLQILKRMPEPAVRASFAAAGAAVKLGYPAPGNYARRTVRDFARVLGRDDPRAMYGETVDKVMRVAATYVQLLRGGGERVAASVRLAPQAEEICERLRRDTGHALFVIPHCTGSVLSAAGFGRRYPAVLLMRESRDPRRSALTRTYLERLGPELCYARSTDASTVTRRILQAVRRREFVVGTTDLIRKTADTLPARMFGQEVWLPAWPARFSARLRMPIVPAYVTVDREGITMRFEEPYLEDDPSACTQRWASVIEDNFRRYPTDWAFQFDKRWSKVLAIAAGTRPRSPVE